jgi:hypothetical protein
LSDRHVKGTLFVDYVRMIRAYKAGRWVDHLTLEDLQYLTQRIEPEAWYPMGTFERMGLAILAEIRPDLETIRAWGRFSVDLLIVKHPDLLVHGDAMDTLMRFRVLRASFFDYAALAVTDLTEGEATLTVAYGMSAPAEEAASYQTLGFFERLLEASGANDVVGTFTTKVWRGDLITTASLLWRPPRR